MKTMSELSDMFPCQQYSTLDAIVEAKNVSRNCDSASTSYMGWLYFQV